MKDSRELRQEIIDTCLWLKAQGLIFATWGNISVRLEDGNILITPSRVDYETTISLSQLLTEDRCRVQGFQQVKETFIDRL